MWSAHPFQELNHILRCSLRGIPAHSPPRLSPSPPARNRLHQCGLHTAALPPTASEHVGRGCRGTALWGDRAVSPMASAMDGVLAFWCPLLQDFHGNLHPLQANVLHSRRSYLTSSIARRRCGSRCTAMAGRRSEGLARRRSTSVEFVEALEQFCPQVIHDMPWRAST